MTSDIKDAIRIVEQHAEGLERDGCSDLVTAIDLIIAEASHREGGRATPFDKLGGYDDGEAGGINQSQSPKGTK